MSSKIFRRLRNFCQRIINDWQPIILILGALIIVDWFFLKPSVDRAVEDKINSPQTLEAISAKLRPYALIDAPLNTSSATFEYDDNGAFGKIVDSVDFQQETSGLGAVLTFRMHEPVRLPLVQPLTAGLYVHSMWRTNKYDWAFEIRTAPIAVKDSGVTTTEMNQSLPQNCRFFVQLLTD